MAVAVLALAVAGLVLASSYTGQTAHADGPTSATTDEHVVTISPVGYKTNTLLDFKITVEQETGAPANEEIKEVFIDIPQEGVTGTVFELVGAIKAPDGWECETHSDEADLDRVAAVTCTVAAEGASDDDIGPGEMGTFEFKVNTPAGRSSRFWIVNTSPVRHGTRAPVTGGRDPARGTPGGGGDEHALEVDSDDRQPEIDAAAASDKQELGDDGASPPVPQAVDGSNGKIDTVRVTFDDIMNSESLVESVNKGEWLMGGVMPTMVEVVSLADLDTGEKEGEKFDFTFDVLDGKEVNTTGAIVVVYRGSTAIDKAGNKLDPDDGVDVSDEASPIALSAVTGDGDGNGKIDRVIVTFSEEMKRTSKTDWTVVGNASYEVDDADLDGAVVTVELVEIENTAATDTTPEVLEYDTEVVPTVTLINDLAAETGATSPTDYTVFSERAFDGATSPPVEDGAPAVFVSGRTASKTEVVVVFNEVLKADVVDPEDIMGTANRVKTEGFTVSRPDNTVESAELMEDTSAALTQVKLKLHNDFEASAVPLISYDGELTDVADVRVRPFANKRVDDNIMPSLLSVTLTDENDVIGPGDELEIIFDEPIEEGTFDDTKDDYAGIEVLLAVSKGEGNTRELGAAPYGTGPTVTHDAASLHMVTIMLGTTPTIEKGDIITPSAQVVDVADNPADTAVTQEIVEVSLTLELDPGSNTIATNGDDIVVDVHITKVDDLDAIKYMVMFDSSVLTYGSGEGSTIGTVDIGLTANAATADDGKQTGTLTVVQNAPDAAGVDVTTKTVLGKLTFTYDGVSGDPSTFLQFMEKSAFLGDNTAREISINARGKVTITAAELLGDANEDGMVSALDTTAVELIVVGTKIKYGTNANADGKGDVTVLDITATERLVVAAGGGGGGDGGDGG